MFMLTLDSNIRLSFFSAGEDINISMFFGLNCFTTAEKIIFMFKTVALEKYI